MSSLARSTGQVRLRALLPIGLLVSVIAAPVVFSLAARVPNVKEELLFPDEPRNLPEYHVEAGYDTDPDTLGAHVASITLYLADPSVLVRYDRLNVLMVTFDTRPTLVEGRLFVQGTGCSYNTPSGTTVTDRDILPLVRAPGCVPLHGQPRGTLELSVRFEGRGRVGVLARLPPQPTADPATIYASEKQARALFRPALLGSYGLTLGKKGPRRVELLNYVWQLAPRPWWIWAALGIVSVLIAAGIRVFPWTRTASAPSPLAAGFGASCFAAAIALAYVVLVPPFQAPDEPDHLLTYAGVSGRPELQRAAEDWARLMHFQRIRFHPLQKFREADIGHPHAVPWDADVFAENVAARSVTTFRLWTTLGRVMTPLTVQRTLMTLRLVNAAIFAIAVGLACALAVWCTEAPGAPLACFTFLFVPTLPFFAMHVSEFAVLSSTYVMLAAGTLILFLGGRRNQYAGWILGVSGGLLMTSGRSAVPVVPVLVAALAGRVILGEEGATSRRDAVARAATFWSGIVAGALVFWLWSTPPYRQQLAKLTEATEFSFPARWVDSAGVLLAVAAMTGVIGFACEIALARARPLISRRAVDAVVRVVARGAALAVIGLMLGTLGQILPHAIAAPPAPWDYVSDVLWTAATGLRLHDPDMYLSSSFWLGFGWLETVPPTPLVVTLTTMTGLAMAALLWHLAEQRDARRVALGSIYVVGWCGALILYALSAHSMSRVLVGRYLIGLYLAVLVIAWSGPLLTPASPADDKRWPRWLPAAPRAAVLLTLCGAVHAYCLSFIVSRYF